MSDKNQETVVSQNVLVRDIVVEHDFNARRQYDDKRNYTKSGQTVEDLAKNMKANGQLTPVILRPHNTKEGKYSLVDGFRRVGAATTLGWETIRAEIHMSYEDQKAFLVNLISSLARKDLTTFEIADRCVKLSKMYNWESKEVSRNVQLSSKYVANLMRCRENLHKTIIEAWRDNNGVCNITNLANWASLEKPEQLEKFKEATGEKEKKETSQKSKEEKKLRARHISTLLSALAEAENYTSKATGLERARGQGVVDALKFACQSSPGIEGVYQIEVKQKGKPGRPKKNGLPAEAIEAIEAEEMHEETV